ncbi:hypothetical protein NDU88_003823 [Pleurodeles waltl]|uniref:TMEM248/TMEM219 domain-containing protein n=1 Tax=Pleurodeles waltl TaxID=8319 RepID=A0AAV7PAN5_PLEWA|nr:hypothetical protein NDU88_003823 [Pleurodeles waltl]
MAVARNRYLYITRQTPLTQFPEPQLTEGSALAKPLSLDTATCDTFILSVFTSFQHHVVVYVVYATFPCVSPTPIQVSAQSKVSAVIPIKLISHCRFLKVRIREGFSRIKDAVVHLVIVLAAMVTCPLGENVLACCEQRPPHVTFILCLFTLAVAFGALGAYINSNEVTDPDIRQDWNTFLQSLSDNLFCLPTNNTEDWSPDLWPIASPVLNETDNAGHPQSWVTVSLLASLTFLPTWGIREVLIHNRVRLETQIRGHKLGLTGPGAEEILNITAVPWHPQGCGGATFCLLSEITDSCITLTVPASLLPSTRKPPDCGVHPLTRTLVTPGTTARSKSDGSWKTPPCYQGKYRWQPSLTTMLTEGERSRCRIHLLFASCILFLLASGLCCIGAVSTVPTRDRRLREHL